MVPAALLASVIADIFDDPSPVGPDLPAGRIVVAEFILWTNFVFQGTLFVTVGQGGECAGAEALLLQGQAVPVPVRVLHHRNLRHPVTGQPLVHDRQIFVGVGLLTSRICKQDQVDRSPLQIQADQHSGRVQPPAIRHDSELFAHHRPPASPNSFLL